MHIKLPELKLKPSLFPGRPETTMQVMSHFPALDLRTSPWYRLLATLRPQDVTPSCLQTPWNPSFFILFSPLLAQSLNIGAPKGLTLAGSALCMHFLSTGFYPLSLPETLGSLGSSLQFFLLSPATLSYHQNSTNLS